MMRTRMSRSPRAWMYATSSSRSKAHMSAGSVQRDIGTLHWRCWPSDRRGSVVRLLDWDGPTVTVNRGLLLDTYARAGRDAHKSAVIRVGRASAIALGAAPMFARGRNKACLRRGRISRLGSEERSARKQPTFTRSPQRPRFTRSTCPSVKRSMNR